jgi:hypothetical protein
LDFYFRQTTGRFYPENAGSKPPLSFSYRPQNSGFSQSDTAAWQLFLQ